MADIGTLFLAMERAGRFTALANNPRVQFGPRDEPFIGAQLLPEQTVTENFYEETQIRYKTFVANDNTRYSPPTPKEGALVGSFFVFLSEQDTATELTSREYDVIRRYLRIGGTMEAAARVIQWSERGLVRPLAIKNEVMRWQAIELTQVTRRGANNFTEQINYSNPTGHRIPLGVPFSDDTADPFDSIVERQQFLRGKGIRLRAIYTSTNVMNLIANNAKVRARLGPVIVTQGGAFLNVPGNPTNDALAGLFRSFGLPVPIVYDAIYETQTGAVRYISDDVMIFIGATEREAVIPLSGAEMPLILPSTLGYLGVGVAAGQDAPGRATWVEWKRDKPPRGVGQSWQTSLPVIQDPEAIATLQSIT